MGPCCWFGIGCGGGGLCAVGRQWVSACSSGSTGMGTRGCAWAWARVHVLACGVARGHAFLGGRSWIGRDVPNLLDVGVGGPGWRGVGLVTCSGLETYLGLTLGDPLGPPPPGPGCSYASGADAFLRWVSLGSVCIVRGRGCASYGAAASKCGVGAAWGHPATMYHVWKFLYAWYHCMSTVIIIVTNFIPYVQRMCVCLYVYTRMHTHLHVYVYVQ